MEGISNGSLGENSSSICMGKKMVEAMHGLVYSSREDLKSPAAAELNTDEEQ